MEIKDWEKPNKSGEELPYDGEFNIIVDSDYVIIKSYRELIEKVSNDNGEFHRENPVSLKETIIGNSLKVLISQTLKSQKEAIIKEIEGNKAKNVELNNIDYSRFNDKQFKEYTKNIINHNLEDLISKLTNL